LYDSSLTDKSRIYMAEMNRAYFVYILTTKKNTALYIGVTNDLIRRADEHTNKTNKGFTSRYNIDRLVFYEIAEDIETAIAREKQLKAGNRNRRPDLINSMNPTMKDLLLEITG
jgi:putative endonuclease